MALRFEYHGIDDPHDRSATINLFDGDELVGGIYVIKGDQLPEEEYAEPHTPCWQVRGIDVLEGFRRKGFGTKLYLEMAKAAAKYGLALCSDIPEALSRDAEAFWEKQRKIGNAFWEVPGPDSRYDENYEYGRFVLKYPPPASLGRCCG